MRNIELKRHYCLSNTVGLVVEYSPATGETRVRFPDGVSVIEIFGSFCFMIISDLHLLLKAFVWFERQ
jgi:hypothetical protein